MHIYIIYTPHVYIHIYEYALREKHITNILARAQIGENPSTLVSPQLRLPLTLDVTNNTVWTWADMMNHLLTKFERLPTQQASLAYVLLWGGDLEAHNLRKWFPAPTCATCLATTHLPVADRI